MILYGNAVQYPGPHHEEVRENIQDKYGIYIVPSLLKGEINSVAAIVCDGCGSSANSEVGAGLIADFGAAVLHDLVYRYSFKRKEKIQSEFLAWIHRTMRMQIESQTQGKEYLEALLREQLGGPPVNLHNRAFRHIVELIDRNLLFTVVAGIITPWGVLILQWGDGGYAVHDEQTLVQFDAPPYLAYHFSPRETLERGVDALKAKGKKVELENLTRPGILHHFPGATQMALYTDGFKQPNRLAQLWELLDPIVDWKTMTERSRIRRNVKAWFREQRDGIPIFDDDLTLVALMRKD